MSLLLEALREIETLGSRPLGSAEPVAEEELVALGLAWPLEPWRDCPAPPDPTVESPLARQTLDESSGSERPDVGEDFQLVEQAVEQATDPIAVHPMKMAEATEAPCEFADPPDRAALELADQIMEHFPEDAPAVLLFTSPSECVDKTHVVARLAKALASRFPGRVVAVDADRGGPASWSASRPGHRVFDGRSGSSSAPTIVSCENLASSSRLLRELRRQARFVLIDAPAVSRDDFLPIVSRCEATYLVLQLGVTTRRAALRATKMIEQSGGYTLGCVVSGTN